MEQLNSESRPSPVKTNSLIKNERGQSLILVLGSLVFLSALVLALLAGFGTELNSSTNYANGASVRELANSTVNFAIGLISTATSGQDTSGNTLAWASQPGMIRTYTTSGALANAYKLYSSTTPVTTSINPTTEAAALANWSTTPAFYTDLNAPITDPLNSANTIYPILDPAAADSTTSATSSQARTGVEGFWFTKTTDPSTLVQIPTGVSNGQMPVTWLYVLKGGQIIAPDTPTGATTTATFTTYNGKATGTNQLSVTNPIVGRIAFWTDDETCKVNINTASAGYYKQNGASAQTTTPAWYQTFWDTPRESTFADIAMGKYQPYQNEFQRYPGHPAMTDLTTALPGPLTSRATPLPSSSSQVINYCSSIYNLTPRYNSSGGSQVATVVVPTNTGTLSPMALMHNRLYSSIDELMFAPTVTSGTRNSQSVTLVASSPTISESNLEQSRFFLTANSRAPEVNMFNQPRISMWPITSTSQTAMDNTLAFCSTVNGSNISSSTHYTYYFKRADPTSPTADMPATVTSPGLARNLTLFKYLQTLTSAPVPGFGGGPSGLLSAYSATGERDQILTEMFDYIRCININDTSSGATPFAPYTAATAGSPGTPAKGGQVVPICLSATQTGSVATMGFGRFAMPYEIGMDFVCVGKGKNTTSGAAAVAVDQHQKPIFAGKDGVGTPDDNTVALQAILVMSFMNPGAGEPTYFPSFTIQVSSGMDQFTMVGSPTSPLPSPVAAVSMGFQASAATYVSSGVFNISGTNYNYGQTSGGIFEPLNFVANKTLDSPYTGTTTMFPFYSNVIEVPITTGKFTFTGGPITIKIYAGNSTSASSLIQTISNITIPSSPAAGYSIPSISDPGERLLGAGTAYPYVDANTDADRFISVIMSNPSSVHTFFGWDFHRNGTSGGQDNIQSVVIPHGDGRMAFRQTIDNSLSTPPALFAQDDINLTGSVNASFIGAVGNTATYQQCQQGNLVSSIGPYLFHEITPHTIDAASRGGAYVNDQNTMPMGDYDSGPPNQQDGPYINKVDEGDITSTGSYTPYYPGWTGYTAIVNSFFSPNRMVPSSGMFGSLSTGVLENKPWRTLLFHPDLIPQAGSTAHPGAGITSGSYANGTSGETPTTGSPGPYTTLPDHLFMDLFWMPVVEPYPISEPFSTAGKVNMNYQIMPFAFINRETAIRAVLKWERPMAIPSNPGTASSTNVGYIEQGWKDMNDLDSMNNVNEPNYSVNATDWRYQIDLDKTLTGFRQRFAANDIFRSASEICLLPLVPAIATSTPAGATGTGTYNPSSTAWTYANMFDSSSTGFWYNHVLTGDNLRERPYTNIYPRLTTKSNTYTVHYKVQTLKQLTADATAAKWVEGTDVVNGEYRGSSIIERYIDPNVAVDDYADPVAFPTPRPISTFYKFRVVSTKQFSP